MYVNKRNETEDLKYRFEINLDLFSMSSEASLGQLKLQSWYKSADKTGSNLVYINWNESKRCIVQSWLGSSLHQGNLLAWISTRGRLKLEINGDRAIKNWENCMDNSIPAVTGVRLTLFDMKYRDNLINADQLFDITFEKNQLIGKSGGFGGQLKIRKQKDLSRLEQFYVKVVKYRDYFTTSASYS